MFVEVERTGEITGFVGSGGTELLITGSSNRSSYGTCAEKHSLHKEDLNPTAFIQPHSQKVQAEPDKSGHGPAQNEISKR